jgi:hypothetical protein
MFIMLAIISLFVGIQRSWSNTSVSKPSTRAKAGLIPTLAFLLKVTAGIEARSQAANRGMMGFGFSENNGPVPANDHKYLVAGPEA